METSRMVKGAADLELCRPCGEIKGGVWCHEENHPDYMID